MTTTRTQTTLECGCVSLIVSEDQEHMVSDIRIITSQCAKHGGKTLTPEEVEQEIQEMYEWDKELGL